MAPVPVQNDIRMSEDKSSLKPSAPPLLATQAIPPTAHIDGIPVVAEEIAHIRTNTPYFGYPPSFYEDFFSETAKGMGPNPIRKVIPLSKIPGMLSIFGGLPAPETFPFESISMKVRSPETPSQLTTIDIEGESLDLALQYTDTGGIFPFVSWLCDLQEREHKRNLGEGWTLSVGSGSQDLLFNAFLCLLNPGDYVIVEAPVYAGVIPLIHLFRCHAVEVPTDGKGIRSDKLAEILEAWPSGQRNPKFLYTVPYGCNPTGASATLERRKDVLQLARAHNFLILEDDPYFYLYYGRDPKAPSYFELEKSSLEAMGRVVRFDSFSKILSAGVRLGFMSAPEPISNAVNLVTSSSNLQASSMSQMMVYTLLNHWRYAGFKQHTENVAQVYRSKRDLFETALKAHLVGLAEWNTPEAGMFVWIKLFLPLCTGSEEGDSEDLIERAVAKHKVLALPGTSFYANGRTSAYIRASFSVLPEHQFGEVAKRLALVIREAQVTA